MKKNYALLAATLFLFSGAMAQNEKAADTRNCGSMEALEAQLQQDPTLAKRMEQIEQHTAHYLEAQQTQKTATVVRIPVVVHVVYRTTAQNVSNQMIYDQIAVLNRDFRKMNADAGSVPSHFAGLAADTEIEFCLATRDPQGNPTTGITRTKTKKVSFSTNNGVKHSSTGGKDAWPAGQYLNLWVCNLGQSLLGYAQFPGGSAATDGVVVLYSSLPGGSAAPYNLGRTATHEVGHWLNRRHSWGDATCGNDLVSDTPLHNTSNGGCPASNHRSTCSGTPLEMWMNYMDYTYDQCMYMFTTGQKTRMHAVLAPGGARYSLLSSTGCNAPGAPAYTSAEDELRMADSDALIYPNPVSHDMTVAYTVEEAGATVSLEIYNALGQRVSHIAVGKQAAGNHRYSVNVHQQLGHLANGAYMCVVKTGNNQRVIRFMLAR